MRLKANLERKRAEDRRVASPTSTRARREGRYLVKKVSMALTLEQYKRQRTRLVYSIKQLA